MKTFQQWSEANDFKFSALTHDGKYPTVDGPAKWVQVFPSANADTPGLFRLSDFIVSSALSGPSYILVPRIVPPVAEVTPV